MGRAWRLDSEVFHFDIRASINESVALQLSGLFFFFLAHFIGHTSFFNALEPYQPLSLPLK